MNHQLAAQNSTLFGWMGDIEPVKRLCIVEEFSQQPKSLIITFVDCDNEEASLWWIYVGERVI